MRIHDLWPSATPEMFSSARLLSLPRSWINRAQQLVKTAAPSRASSQCPVHPDLMKVLVCPLSKEPLRYIHVHIHTMSINWLETIPSCIKHLCGKCNFPLCRRYEPSTNELVCDKLGVAYPILEDGIPNLVPEDGRLLHQGVDASNQKPRTTNESSTITVKPARSEP